MGVDIYNIAQKHNLNLFILEAITVFSGADPVRVARR